MMRNSITLGVLIVAAVACTAGTLRNAYFWRTPDRQGQALAREGKFAEASKAYEDPWAIGWAQYRDGDFAEAAKTFARVPGAVGAYNQGNALLMHGAYNDAIAAYDRALKLQAGWQAAVDNRAIAVARRDRIAHAADDEVAQDPAYAPDEIVFDGKGKDSPGKPVELAGGAALSDEALQATWLRRVQTTPGDFLKAKFAYQAQQRQETSP